MSTFTRPVLGLALLAAGIACAQADSVYYNPANAASSTGYTSGYELFRTIGCPGKQLLDKACPVPAPAAAPVPASAPAAEPAATNADSDHDGVADAADQCPDTPAGRTVDAKGCELDGDHDGVVDALDKCPDTPAGDKVDANGCSIVKTIILHGVNFDVDSAKLRPESFAVLDQAYTALKMNNCPATEVAGYTDSTAADAYNLRLSQRRADTVKDYLVNKGCPTSAFTSKGYGETNPVADNKTAAGRFENRRVELHVTQTVYETK